MSEVAPEYVAARTVLLDALEALGSQREAITVVGAQAVYLRTGDSGIRGVAPYTTDADLALLPSRLADEPHLENLMGGAGFEQRGEPGVWRTCAPASFVPCRPGWMPLTDVKIDNWN